jgi:MoaA/NifB/PqqE/SkfB family radical SAM enzyme
MLLFPVTLRDEKRFKSVKQIKNIGGEVMNKVLVGNPSYYELCEQVPAGQLLMLILDLPFACNLRCLKCYRMGSEHRERLDVAVYQRAIEEAQGMGARVVAIPGEGEPLVRWSLVKQLVTRCNSLGMTALIYTNATLLDREKAEWLYNHGASIVMSCDAFNPETFHALTGGNINVVRANMEVAREIFSRGVVRQDGTVITRLGVITIAMRQNLGEIGEIHEWCGDHVFHIVNFPIREGAASQNWPSIVGDEIDQLKDIASRYTDTGHGGLTAPMRSGHCVALHNGVTVNAAGDVQVCPAACNNVVGNVSSSSLQELREKCRVFLTEKGTPLCLARDIRAPQLTNHGIGLTKI